MMEPEPCHISWTLHSRRKRSDIHSQTHLTSHDAATYFQCNYCTQKYKRSGGTRNIRDHLTKVHGWDGLTTLKLKRKRENHEIDVVMERYAPNGVKRWEAKQAELLKNSINKDTLEYLYVRYTVNTSTPFLRCSLQIFEFFLSISIQQQIRPFLIRIIPFGLGSWNYIKKGSNEWLDITSGVFINSNYLWCLDNSKSYWGMGYRWPLYLWGRSFVWPTSFLIRTTRISLCLQSSSDGLEYTYGE